MQLGQANKQSTAVRVTGLVLAGGAATRMGGEDKGLVRFEGRPLVEHVLGRLRGQCSTIVISANRNLDVYRGYGCEVVSDCTGGFQGPLTGIYSSLALVATPFVQIAPCDAPYLPRCLTERLLTVLEAHPESLCAAPVVQGHTEPLFMVMRTESRKALGAFLAAGGKRVHEWVRRSNCIWVEFEDPFDFSNFNSKEDLKS